MQPRITRWCLIGTVGCVLVFLAGAVIGLQKLARAEPPEHETLTVFAASSLQASFEQLASEFRRQNPDVDIQLTFGGSQDLRKQIEHGARADVFASADLRQMDMLTDRGRVERPAVFAHNELVIVVPEGNPSQIETVADLKKAKHLAIGDDSVPVGRYTEEMLARASRELGAEFESEVLARVASRERSVRDIVAKIAAGNADAGIVYRSDVRQLGNKVETVEIDGADNVVATYPIAVVSKSQALDTAVRFIQFVRSSAGEQILADNGFQTQHFMPPRASSRVRTQHDGD